MAIAGTVEIQMLADLTRLKNDMAGARRTVTDATNSMGNAAKKLTGLLATLGLAFGARAIFGFLDGLLKASDELSKLSQKVNISVESLIGWQHAADLSGVSSQSFTKGLKSLTTQMFDAASGLLESQRNFRALDIEVKKTDGTLKDADKVMLEISNRFSRMENGAEKTALAVKLFGKAGLDMIVMLNQGEDALKSMREEGERFNTTTTEQAKLSEDFNDNVNRLSKAMGGFFIRAMNGSLEAIVKLTNAMVAAEKAGASMWGTLVEGLQTFLTGDDLHKWNVEMVEAVDSLLKAENQLSKLRARAAQDPTAGIKSFWKVEEESAARAVDKIKKDIERLQKIKETLTGNPFALQSNGKKDTFTPTIEVAGGRDSDKAAAKALAAIQKEEDSVRKLTEQYLKQKTLLGETSEAAKIRYDIEFGSLKGVNSALTDTLLLRAQELDSAKQQIEIQELTANAEEARAAKMRETEAANTDARDKAALLKEQEEARLQVLRDSVDSEDNLRRNRFDREMQQLEAHRKTMLISDKEFFAIRNALIFNHEDDQAEIRIRAGDEALKFNRMTEQKKAEDIFGMMENITAGVAQHSRKLFEINKVAGIANAILNAYEGISLTLAKYPYPFNIALAALHGAVAFAQVSAINSTTFGGGGAGAAPSLSGSTPATPVTPVGGDQGGGSSQTTIVNFVGSTNERKIIRDFVKGLNESSRDGSQILVNP